MLDLEFFDKKYSINYNPDGKVYYICRNDTDFDVFKGKYKVSEILEKIASGEFAKGEFRCDSHYNLEDYIYTKLLNDEIKVITHCRYALTFGSLDHFIKKEKIEIPKDYLDFCPEYTKETYSIANQVLWLEEVKEENRELVERLRKTLRNLLKYNETWTVDEILNS